MRAVALILLAFVLAAGPARADTDTRVLRVAPSADVSLPYWCDWSYDWEARCWRDFSDRFSIGGDEDKVWRAAIGFPLATIPSGSAVLSATLHLSFDGVCLGPRKSERPCPPRAYTIDIHPILGADWFHEREVDIGPLVAEGSFWTEDWQRLQFDVTDQVIEWVEHGAPNDGLLLKLADREEEYGVGGPRLPSAEFADASRRPLLEVTYMPA